MMSTLLLDSKLPPEYRSYAARYAAVILMKTSNKDPCPWTRLTGRAGGVDSLLRFGQRCFVQVPKEVRRKNDLTIEKGEMGILLGPERDRQWLDYTTRPRRSDHSFKGRTIH
jgi:hypothetical protein